MNINEKKAENSPAGGVLVGKKDGQTIIHDEGTMSGYLVGKLHKDGGIKAVNKATGQPLEMQGGEVVITAPAVSDQTKREFEGKMMTNREILSAINEKGGGVSFAKGGDIPKSFKTSGASYKYGGKTMKDHEILKAINGSGHLSKGKSLKQIAEMHNVSLAHINKELDKGLEVEKEHFSDFKERTRVAKDHLVENPNYYTLLKKAGLENGGAFDSKPFLDYYFEEIAIFLKSQNDIVLKNDYTFFYRGEKFVIEPMILVNKDISESIKVANFNILDSDDLIVGEIDFDASNKNKFVAYSDFFEWNNIKFNNGGSINNQNNFLLNKSNRLKSFYKTNNPSIDKLLNDLQPKIEELIEKQKELVINLTLKMNGVAMPMTESDVEFYEAGLIFKMVQSFNKYLKNTDELYDVSINNRGGLFEVNGKVKRDGRTYRFDTELIGAGGYNIQEYHYRYIIKTDLPSSNENLAVENIKAKMGVLKKIRTIDEDIERYTNLIKKDEEELKQGFKFYKILDVEYKKDLSDFDIKSRQRYIKEFTNDIKKLEGKKEDLLSIFESLNKKVLGVNFGKEVKEAIGRRILVDRLRGSKYKETGNTLDFKIENRSIRGAKIDERSYESLGDINTFSFIDEGNGLCTMKAGLELRGKYTLYAEYKNLPIKEIPYKINEIFNGEFSKYLEYNNGGEIGKQNLIKPSKKEDSSDMDLDSFNDIMDLEADRILDGNNGVFADGGGVDLPKVAYVTIENAGSSLIELIGKRYNTYLSFAESIEYVYKQLGKKIRSFVNLNAYDENDLKLTDVYTYISDQKNTVRNFNPFTGNYKNLEKSLSNSRPISFKKYNWEDWFQSKIKPKSVSKTIEKEYPEYYEFISETNIGSDGLTRFTKNKIYKIRDPKNIEGPANFIDDRGKENGFRGDNAEKFKPSTKEAYEAQEGIVSEVDELKYPKYYEYIGGSNEGFTKGKIYKIANPKNLADTKNFLNNKGEFDGYAENNYKYFIPSTREAYEAYEAGFDFSNTKINVKDNSVLSLRVQQKAFDSGWEWEKGAGGGKVLNFDDFNYLYFTKTSISYGNSYESFKNSPKKEITEQDIFGIKPKEESTQESIQEGTFEIKEGDYLTGRWLKCVKKNDWSSDIGRPNVGDYLKIVDVSIVSLKGSINVTNKIGGNEKLAIDRITKQKEFQLMPEGFSPEETKEIIKPKESTQEGTFEIKKGDDLTGRWLKCVKENDWSSGKGKPNVGDYLKIVHGEIRSLTGVIDDVTNKVGNNESLSVDRITKRKEFQLMPEGFSPEEVKETKTLKLSNLKKGDRFTFPLTQEDIDLGMTKIDIDNKIYVFDSKEKSTYYYKSGDFVFNTTTNRDVNLVDIELVDIEKPIDIKPKRNFELERKYFHKRIAELSKQLDLKKPILSNEEIGFYQREINNLIFKLRKLNEEEEALTPINERLEKIFSLKFGDFDKQYIETDLTSPNGIKSELTEEQYFAVRTEGFKSFFGDWMLAIETNNYNGISKIINPKTKEPLAVWHGTNVLFTTWKTYQTNNAHYFAVKKEMSEFFAKSWESRTDKAAVDSKALKTLNPNKGKYLLRCFLDIKNPVDFSRFGVEKRPVKEFLLFLKINYNIGDYDFWTKAGNMFGLAPDAKVYAWQIIRNWQAFTQYIKTFTTYDGYIFYEYIPDKEFSGLENASLSFCAFESNQIKFDNAVEFNALANDSRFNLGGKI